MFRRDYVLSVRKQKELAMTHALIYPSKHLYIFDNNITDFSCNTQAHFKR